MIAVTAWLLALVGIVVFLGIGVLLMLLLGLLGAPADFFRRAGQSASAPRMDGAVPLSDEVPEATAEETAREAGERRD